jgi:hypothetical protein
VSPLLVSSPCLLSLYPTLVSSPCHLSLSPILSSLLCLLALSPPLVSSPCLLSLSPHHPQREEKDRGEGKSTSHPGDRIKGSPEGSV